MSIYYVEFAESEGVLPVALSADILSGIVANCPGTTRHLAPISSNAAHLFSSVDAWATDTLVLSPQVFRHAVATLLWEGHMIADQQRADGSYSLISPKPQYDGAPLDDIAVLEKSKIPKKRRENPYEFTKDAAREFMARMIREGMAQWLRELVERN